MRRTYDGGRLRGAATSKGRARSRRGQQSRPAKQGAHRPTRGSKTAASAPPAWWRLWLFRVVAVIFIPALFCLLLEWGLRAVGWGHPAAALVRCRIEGKVHLCDNPRFAWRFFPRRLARLGEPFAIPAVKEAGACRIFVLGASAAQGTPEPAYGFSRILRTMLAEAYPHTNFEVVNTAITAINSHVVVEIARDCARYEPDLFIVYLGNNEVVGPYGPGTVFTSHASALPLIRLSIRLKATRLGQLLTAAVSRRTAEQEQPSVWKGMEMFLGNQLRATDPRIPNVYRHFRANLAAIRRIAHDSGAAVVFCTVAGNRKDCPPFASLHRTDLEPDQLTRWQETYEQGIAQEQAGRWDLAVQRYQAAEQIDDTYAELHFRRARCLAALGQWEPAREGFDKACELDTLRFRADGRINEIIRQVARDRMAQGVHLVDAADIFKQQSPHQCPGGELFHEHVHLNFAGNYLLAHAVFEELSDALPQRVTALSDRQGPPLSEESCAQRLAYTAWDRSMATRKVLDDFIRQPPFTNQAYHDERVRDLEQELALYDAFLTSEALQQVKRQYEEAIRNDPDDGCLRFRYARLLAEVLKESKQAVEQFRLVVRRLPHDYKAHVALGVELLCLGNYRESIEHSLRAVEIMPTFSVAHNNLGTAYVHLNMPDKAKPCFQRALYWLPDNVPPCHSLVDILVQAGDTERAIAICRRTLQFAPDDALLHCKLGVFLSMQGRREEAMKEIREAARLDPNSPKIREVLDAVTPN